VRELLAGHAEPASAALPPGLLPPDTHARELTLDRDAARRLLADARLPAGFEPTLTVSRRAAPLPARAAAAGVDDPRRPGPGRAHAAPARGRDLGRARGGDVARDFELALLGWRADTLDPNDFLTALFDSGSIGTTNRSRYRSDTMDALLKRARQDRSPASRLALYRQAQDLVQNDLPLVPSITRPCSPRTAARCAGS
jgi:ABC-type transport system substrate-binding protein